MKLVVPAPLLVVLARRRLAVHRRQHRQVRRREDDKQVVGLDLHKSAAKRLHQWNTHGLHLLREHQKLADSLLLGNTRESRHVTHEQAAAAKKVVTDVLCTQSTAFWRGCKLPLPQLMAQVVDGQHALHTANVPTEVKDLIEECSTSVILDLAYTNSKRLDHVCLSISQMFNLALQSQNLSVHCLELSGEFMHLRICDIW
mmetsp:Transcript_25621/g.56113  ORF Transcript_25621/g.56113 Transcript_25621/m.56113 type:complete len:200 (-) Transcript_25621:79-678(-)